MNLLIIAHQFPPLNTGGSHRPFKFAKHLPSFGVTPFVVTPKASLHGSAKLDKSLLNEVTDEISIIRTDLEAIKKADRFADSYYFNIVDIHAGKWKSYLFEAIEKLLQTTKIDACFITAPPFSMAKLGIEIKEKFQLPYILDMRDAWSHWVVTPYASYWHYRKTLQLERKALSAADAIVVTSPQTIQDFQQLHPNIPKERFHLITNAYDEEPPNYSDLMPIEKATLERPIRIGYVGSFYYTPYQRKLMFDPWWKKKPHQYLQYTPRKEDWLYRSPYFFFQALAKLKENESNLSDLLEVDFIGHIPDWLESMIQDFGLTDLVNLNGPKSHAEALAFQAECDALLITSAKVVGGRDYSIAGKTFEYICKKKPILAFVCEGAQKDLLEETGLSISCPPDNPLKSAEILSDLINGKLKLKPNQKYIKSLHIKETTKKLAELLKQL
jgi:hypothetical protein